MVKCDRRTLLGGAGAALLLAGGKAIALTPSAGGRRERVTTYFNDTLLVDPTGIMPAYRRPRAFPGAGRLAKLSEAERLAAGYRI